MHKERVLITVKTYPTLSRKYGETVCTAGMRADGTWVRIYPVPFRRLEETEQYRKFDWVEVDLVRNHSDPRPETFHATDFNQFVPAGHMDTEDNWRERRRLVLDIARVHTQLKPLMDGAKQNTVSLAVFKPAKIRDFIWEDDDRDWDTGKVAQMRDKANQTELFPEEAWRQTFQLIPKLPYTFSYLFEDADGRKSTLQVLDWECGQLYWNCFRRCGDEQEALEKVKSKYLDELARKRDVHFFLGTMQQYHGFSPNPWVIIGVFAPPFQQQLELL